MVWENYEDSLPCSLHPIETDEEWRGIGGMEFLVRV